MFVRDGKLAKNEGHHQWTGTGVSRAGSPVKLGELLQALELKSDRVAVEHNGSIVARGEWAGATVNSGDKLEIVHFVGGGRR